MRSEDRGEAPAEEQGTSSPAEGRARGLGTLPGRFVVLYPVLFMLPFPLTLLGNLYLLPGFEGSLPGESLAWVLGLHSRGTQPVVAWMGRLLTGADPSFEFTGSGDGLASYLGALLNLLLAGGLAIAWWAWRRATPVSAVVRDLSQTVLRYYVGTILLSYGFSKVFPVQFSVMGPDRLLQPYGDSSPMGLLWTFMGASPGYQVFAGAAEVLGGGLLLFRRTTLLGALIVMGVMANVFAMNVFFDVPVKLYSFHYLLFSGFLVLPDAGRLHRFFLGSAAVPPRDLRPFWSASRPWRVGLGIVKAALLLTILATNIDARIERMRSSGLWAETHELHGVYRVTSFELLAAGGEAASIDRAVPDPVRWVRVGLRPPWAATVQCADGTATRLRMRLDEEASTLALYDRSFSEPPTEPLKLVRLDAGRLRLEGVFEDRSVSVTLARDEEPSLFESRGFRWINEYPFNR